MKKSSVIVNYAFLIFGIVCILFYLACGLAVRFGQSLLFLWPLLGAACIARFILWKRAWKQGKKHPFSKGFLIALRCVVAAGLALFVFVQCLILPAAFRKASDGLDAIVVLGARVEADGPSGSLDQRIRAAADYLERNPDTLCVASGGQGADEPMSEAECIRQHLIARGIDGGRILTEDTSTNTRENLSNSFALLPTGTENIGIVTSDFHIYRALCTGRVLTDAELSGVPARSTVSGFIHYSMREFFAIAVSTLRGELRFR